MRTRVVVSWSGGKDSVLSLDRLLRDRRYEILALLTTIEEASQRVTAHGVRVDLIERQAASLGLPLLTVELPSNPSNTTYLERLERTLAQKTAGAAAMAFGDIFLQDLRDWREESLSAMGLGAVFPLWHVPPEELSAEFFARGYSAVICCVNGVYLNESYLGRLYDERFLESLPARVDRCGENGEFHSFAFDGPIFRRPVEYVIGGVTYEPLVPASAVQGHWFCDLIAAQSAATSCPLCGNDNACAAAAGREKCWCFMEQIPSEVQNRVPPYARNLACICAACATASSPP